MTLLADVEGEYMSSNDMAGSMNVNPVLVRKELAELKKLNLVESKEGKNGGVRLNKAAKDIRMSEIFDIAKGEGFALGFAKNEPNPKCPIGKKMNSNLSMLFMEIDDNIKSTLEKTTLEDFKNQF